MKLFQMFPEKEKLLLSAEILLLFCCFFLPAIYLIPGNQDAESTNLSLNMIQYIFSSIPQLFLLLYVIWLKKEVSLKNFGITLPKPTDFLLGLGLAFILLIITTLFSMLIQVFPDKVRDFVLPANPLKIENNNNFFLVILFSLVTGYKEELFFRSYLLIRCRQLGIRISAAIITCSLLFALLHLYEGLFGFFFAGIVAVFFSIIYLKTKNLNLIAISHGLFNAAMILLSA